MKKLLYVCGCMAALGALLTAAPVKAETATSTLYMVGAQGQTDAVGTVTFDDGDGGLTIRTDLKNLKPGIHGFHIHEKGSCAPAETDGKMTAAGSAGGHYDPDKTGKHLGPDGGGHKGDLPALEVSADGTARLTMQVKNLTAGEIRNRAIMIHEGGDNYSDMPEALGGGGARIACGVIQ